ncbi:pyruvate kinase [Planctomicrobium sp. SH527]|uniref:pyruvate kinase n=1 Tax=Planctomicrobium sp. SH527 TaxID=3448123 RepID=UPI003F5AFECB
MNIDPATVVRSSRTKIIATVGPASSSQEVLRQLIRTGVDVFRLNFSHGTHEGHSAVIAEIRKASQAEGQHVAIMQDLCGPKFRLGPIPGDLVECPLDREFTLVTQTTGEDPTELTCTYTDLPNDLQVGENILFADGTVAMEVIATLPDMARLRVTLPGRLRSRQGINLPGSQLKVPSLTEKDQEDLNWTAQHKDNIEFVCLSFVRTAEDIHHLRKELADRGCTPRIVVKIEKPQAVANLEAIVAATDAVMVARGDLGVEMDVWRVPAIQKEIISLCNALHRPVITATQMLNSMEHSNRPTRAEASDVFNAVVDGTDAVMLSGESAIGNYPIQTVDTMRRICEEAEGFLDEHQHLLVGQSAAPLSGLIQPITRAMVDAACVAGEVVSAPLIVTLTITGRTALAISNRRPSATILAVTPKEQTARALNLCWGITSLVSSDCENNPNAVQEAINWAKSQGLIRTGEHVVIVRGDIIGQGPGRTVDIRQAH